MVICSSGPHPLTGGKRTGAGCRGRAAVKEPRSRGRCVGLVDGVDTTAARSCRDSCRGQRSPVGRRGGRRRRRRRGAGHQSLEGGELRGPAPRDRLHDRQAARRLAGSSPPPRTRAITWSTWVAGAPHGRPSDRGSGIGRRRGRGPATRNLRQAQVEPRAVSSAVTGRPRDRSPPGLAPLVVSGARWCCGHGAGLAHSGCSGRTVDLWSPFGSSIAGHVPRLR